MTEQNSVRQSWVEMRDRLLAAFPRWVIRKLDGEDGASYPLVVKAIPLVIIMLSIASVSVINSRAEAHHADWNSPLVAVGVAVLVPLATLAAALIKDRKWSAVFWAVAIFVAFVSGTIQYNVYVDEAATGIAALEAYAFGYGIPFSEVLFAIMEAVSINQWLVQRAQGEQDAKRKEALRHSQELDNRDDEEKREFERRRREAELRAYEAKLTQDAELAREKALSAIRMKEAKVIHKSDSVNQKLNQNGDSPESILLQFYANEPLASQRDAADSTGISQPRISRMLNQLESKKVIHRNGNGVEIIGRP